MCVRACVHSTNNNEITSIAPVTLKTKLKVKRSQSDPNYQQID